MLKSGKVVISVPANELRNVDLPGSLFEADQLNQMPISDGLKCAYRLIAAFCKSPDCVVRPEIFAHGKARSWLDSKLGPARNHICLSDGTSVRVIDGMDNHVFFYGLGRRKNSESLQNLLTWAPEVFSRIESQINSFHAARIKGRLLQPPTTLSLPKAPVSSEQADVYSFLLHSQSPEESARLIADKGAIESPNLEDFSEVIYIPFSERAAHDATFSRLVAKIIAATYFKPNQCVLLRLPTLCETISDLPEQVCATLLAIRASGIFLPRVAARNVFLVDSDLPEDFFDTHDRVSLIVDDTFELWRYTHAFFTRLHGLSYLLDGDRRRLKGVVHGLTNLLGRPPSGRGTFSAIPPIVLTWGADKAAAIEKS